MKKIFNYSILFLILFSQTFCYAKITKIDHIWQTQKELAAADKDTLIAFDIDNTLLDPNEKMFQIEYLKPEYFDDPKFVQEIQTDFKRLYKTKGPEFKDNFISAIYLGTTFKPVEPEEVTAVKNLQDRGIKVIVLTASYTGKFGKVKSMQELRFKNLYDSGFDFRKAFDIQEVIFDKLAPRDGYYPMFYKGLILSSTSPKGAALGAFLDAIKWMPKKVIFFDELMSNHQSVEKEAKRRGIAYQGFQYMADFQQKFKIQNKALIKFQYDYLVKNGEFLNNKQALEKMEKLNLKKEPFLQPSL